jgi:hypothetical protein
MMDMANILLEETKKVAEVNYRLSWAAADDYRPDLILASVVSISEVRITDRDIRTSAIQLTAAHTHTRDRTRTHTCTRRVWRLRKS